MKIRTLKDIKIIIQQGQKALLEDPYRVRLLVITLVTTTMVLEALSFNNELLSYILVFGAMLLVIPNISFLAKRSNRAPKKYAMLIIGSAIGLFLSYIIGVKIGNLIPIFSNLLSYITILIDLLIIFLLANVIQKHFVVKKTPKSSTLLTTVIVILAIGFSAYNNFANLSDQVFHQDEKFSIQAAKGFSETGRYELWDFLDNESTGEKYSRNNLYTQILALTGDYLDFNEFSMRLPTAIMAVLGTITMFFITKKMTNNNWLAMSATVLWAFNDVVIYFGRFSRGYVFLMFFGQQIVYLAWVLFKSKKFKYDLLALLLIGIFLIVGYNFHQSILLLTPIVGLVILKKYWIYTKTHRKLVITLSVIVAILAGAFILYFRLYQHFGICITCEPQTIYLSHILEPYLLHSPLLLVFASFFLLSITKFKLNFRNISIISLYLSLIMTIFLFNRYEDFRYVATLQPLVIIILVYMLSFYTNFIKKLSYSKSYLIILLTILLIGIQIPNVTTQTLLTNKAQANWINIEGNRIHRRAARPDSEILYDYIFKNTDKAVILKLKNGGISWPDDYYLAKYTTQYPNKEIIFYEESTTSQQCSLSFDLKYSTVKDVPKILHLDEINKQDVPILIVANTVNSTQSYNIDYANDHCQNIAKDLGIVEYIYYEQSKLNKQNIYFPNVFECNNF